MADDLAALRDGHASDEDVADVAGDMSDDALSDEDQPTLTCVGCGMSNKDEDPINKRKRRALKKRAGGEKLKKTKVQWGKTSSRKVKRRNGRHEKVKLQCGSWCMHCVNIYRLRLEKKYKKVDQKKAQALAKNDLQGNVDGLADAFKGWHSEYVNQKAGGRDRVTTLKAKVKRKARTKQRLIAPKRKFVLLKTFKKRWGEPKQFKCKVCQKRIKGKFQKGVVIRVGEEGIYDLEDVDEDEVERAESIDDGSMVLDENQIQTAFDEEVENLEMNDGVFFSAAELDDKVMALAPKPEGNDSRTVIVDGGSDDDEDSDGDDSDSSSSAASGSDSASEKAKPPTRAKSSPAASSTTAPAASMKREHISGDDEDDGAADDDDPPAAVPAANGARRRVPSGGSGRRPPAKVVPARGAGSRSRSGLAPARAGASKPAQKEEPKDLEALLAKCKEVLHSFGSGDLDSLRGWALKRGIKERETLLASVTSAVHEGDLPSEAQGLSKMVSFMTYFANGENTVHAQLMLAWSELSVDMEASLGWHKTILAKHLAFVFDSGGFEAAVHMFDPSQSQTGGYLASASASSFYKELCGYLVHQLFQKLCPVKVAQSVDLNSLMPTFAAQMETLSPLVADSMLEQQTLNEFKHIQNLSGNHADRSCVQASLAAQRKASSSSLLGTFANSRVGKMIVKVVAELENADAKDDVKQKELEGCTLKIGALKNLGVDDFTSASFQKHAADILGFHNIVAGLSGDAFDRSIDKIKGLVHDIDEWWSTAFCCVAVIIAKSMHIEKHEEEGQGTRIDCELVRADFDAADSLHEQVRTEMRHWLSAKRWAILREKAPEGQALPLVAVPDVPVVHKWALVIKKRKSPPLKDAGFARCTPQQAISFANEVLDVDKDRAAACCASVAAALPQYRTVLEDLGVLFTTSREEIISLVTSYMVSLGGTDGHLPAMPFDRHFFDSCVGENGKLTPQSQQTLLMADVPTSIQQFDHAYGFYNVKVRLGGMSPEVSRQLADARDNISYCTSLLPAAKDTALAQQACASAVGTPASLPEEEAFLLAFSKAHQSNVAAKTAAGRVSAEAVVAFDQPLGVILAEVERRAQDQKAGADEQLSSLNPNILDIKAITKEWDSRKQELINMACKDDVLRSIKAVNKAVNRGSLKRISNFSTALTSTNSNLKAELATMEKNLTEARNTARAMITLRTAAVILDKQLASDVRPFFVEAKTLGVTVPKHIKSQLEALKST